MRLFLLISLILASVGPAAAPLEAAWPERAVNWVVPFEQDTQEWDIAQAIRPRLSSELGVPVNMVQLPQGNGFVAANHVAGARPDGYTLGALTSESTITWELQNNTPYVWAELLPVATGWERAIVLICGRNFPAKRLEDLKALEQGPVLAYQSLDPVSPPMLAALMAAESHGFKWRLKKVEKLDLGLIKSGQADFMVCPLSLWRELAAGNKDVMIFSFLSGDGQGLKGPCQDQAAAWPDPALAQALPRPRVAFFLPAKTDGEAVARLSEALKAALSNPAVVEKIEELCFMPALLTGKEAQDSLNEEYLKQKQILESLNLI